MQRLALVLFVSFMSLEFGLAQIPEDIQKYRSDSLGSYNANRRGILDGNRVRTIYNNSTEVSHWPDGMGGEWPKGSGHNHIDGMTVLIGAKVHLSNGKTITPIEAHYREEFDYDPVLGQQYPWDLEPLPGYTSPASTTPCISSLPLSWPSTWPAALKLPPEYNGEWYSYFGKGVQKNLQESFTVLDDSKDREFTLNPYGINAVPYYPIPSDTNRGGLGLRVEARTLQWDNLLAQDMVFLHYRITNISDFDYDSTCFGFYLDPGIGSFQMSSPANSWHPVASLNMCYWWAEGGVGYPDNYKTGYMGLTFLKTPENKGLTAAATNVLGDKGPTGVWPKNDDVMWQRMNNGFVDTLVQNTNIATVLGTGTFSLPRWHSDTVSCVLIFGRDLDEILRKQPLAQAIARNNYRVPDTLTKLNSFNIQIDSPVKGTVLSGTTTVSWTVSGNVGNTSATVYIIRPDTNWAASGSVDQSSGHGQYYWNTTNARDGVFYKIMIVCAADNGIAIAESDSVFTVNNPGNAAPDILPVTPRGGSYLSGVVPVTWKAGDADGDPTTVNLYYRLAGTNEAWNPIALALPAASGSYLWDTQQASNGLVTLRMVAVSDTHATSVLVNELAIQNDRVTIPIDTLSTLRKSDGTGTFEVHVIDKETVTGDRYVVQFVTLPSPGGLGYNVFDERTGKQKVVNAALGGPGSEGPLFDGLRLAIVSDSTAIIDSASRWTAGSPDVRLSVKRDFLNVSKSLASPSDYQIDWFSGPVDTTKFAAPPRFPKIPVPFLITNMTEQKHVFSIVDDADRNGALSFGDTIRFVENYLNQFSYNLTWQVTYDRGVAPNPAPPSDGDRFMIRTTKPYQSGDTIVFATDRVLSVGYRGSMHPTRTALFQNYPNPFNPSTAIQYTVGGARDEGGGPSHVKLVIYDLLGREVAVLVNERKLPGTYEVSFDGSGLASGMYVFRMTAGPFLQSRKMLLLK